MGLASIALLSLGGLPPLAGFVGKYHLWVSLINKYVNEGPIGLHENLIYILVTSVILSLLSTFYYLRLIKMALFDSFETVITPPVEIRSGCNITSSIWIVAFFGALTIGWVLMLPNLDLIWSRITMSLSANFTNLGVL
jgi:NADH-quinone oxidoreductase subunit N